MNTDPIADLLTRIRNAIAVNKKTVDIPASKLKIQILKILVEEGFIEKFVVISDDKQGIIKIKLKYVGTTPAIQGLKKISKPGLRRYSKAVSIPQTISKLGFTVLSTPKGVMTDVHAHQQNCGGEVLLKVW